MGDLRLVDVFKMNKLTEKVIKIMEEEMLTIAEAEAFPEFLKRRLEKNSELNEKAKQFTVNKQLFNYSVKA